MKKSRIVSLLLAIVMLSMALVSCGGGSKIEVKGTISLMINDEIVFGPYEVACDAPVDEEGNIIEDSAPTVLQAVTEALVMNEIASENDGMALKSVTINGSTYANGNDEEHIYTWYYTVNGAEPKKGRAGTNALVEGDEIVFIYEVRDIEPEDLTPTAEE